MHAQILFEEDTENKMSIMKRFLKNCAGQYGQETF